MAKGIVPDESLFSDAVDFGAMRDKEIVEAMMGRVVVELPEMAGTTRRERASLKAFLTRTDDGQFRQAYARYPVETPRRCIFVGTANEASLPNDPTGNRRFVAIETHDKQAVVAIEDYMTAWRDTLFATALELVGGGARANLPRELVAKQNVANETARVGDPLIEDIVAQYVDGKDKVVLRDALERVNGEQSSVKYGPGDVARALRLLGWRDTRNKAGRWWERVTGDSG